MEVVESEKLPGVKLLKPKVSKDLRGYHAMVYNKELYAKYGIHDDFVEDCVAVSHRGVLRGIHGDLAANKIYMIPHGKVYYVVVDLEEGPTFGTWEAFTLSAKNQYQLYKPARYGAALLTLSGLSVLYYMQNIYYDSSRQVTYRYDDPRFSISWPVKIPILSRRDEEGRLVV